MALIIIQIIADLFLIGCVFLFIRVDRFSLKSMREMKEGYEKSLDEIQKIYLESMATMVQSAVNKMEE